MTLQQLNEWAVDNVSSVSFHYCSMDDYRRKESFLWRGLILYQVQENSTILFLCVEAKCLQELNPYHLIQRKRELVTTQVNQLELDDVRGFFTCLHQRKWWVGCVNEDSSEVLV